MLAWSAAADPAPLSPTYADGPEPEPPCPPLQGEVRTDVAVVGAGFTGLSTALHLTQAGTRVQVLDAHGVGWGGSGRAFGQVVPYSKLSEATLLRHFGPHWGERLLAGLGDGPAVVGQLIQRHGIQCEIERNGLVFAAHAAKAIPALERRARFWQGRGVGVEMVEGDALRALTGTAYYRAALLDRRGLTLNPLAYARGLARAVRHAGGTIHGASEAISLQRQGGLWRVVTRAGALLAEQVVLATDAYSTGLWPGLHRAILPLRGYQLVSRPLPAALLHTVLPGGQALTDTRRLHSGIRMRPDGRLHVSTGGPALSTRGMADVDGAARRIRTLFPHLPAIQWEHRVTGWVGLTRDHLPHIQRLAPGLLAAAGLNGRGIAFGTLLGRDVASRLLGRPENEWLLPDTPFPVLPPRALLRPVLQLLVPAYRAMDSIDLWHG